MMIANVLAEWVDWLSKLWSLNADRWIASGWFVTAVLTVIACIGMVIRIFTSNRNIEP